MVNIQDVNSYKQCQKKQYEMYVCKPPKNTVVFNRLEQVDIVKSLGGKAYYTASEIDDLRNNSPDKFNAVVQLVNQGKGCVVKDDNTFVIAGVVGEMQTISFDTLTKGYSFLSGGKSVEINIKTVKSRCKKDIMDWQVVRSKSSNNKLWACHVPVNQKGQIRTPYSILQYYNGEGVSHGKGDFIVAEDLNGHPDLSTVRVVNGIVFGATYNNVGWSGNLDQSVIDKVTSVLTIDKFPKLSSENKSRSVSNSPDSIYREVARSILLKKNKSIDDVQRVIRSASLADLEKRVKVVDILVSCINSLYKTCVYDFYQAQKHDESEDIRKCIYEDNGSLESKVSDAFSRKGVSIDQVLSALSLVHQDSCARNINNLTNPEFKSKQYMFLDLEYIGWDEVSSYLIYMMPVIKFINRGNVSTDSLRHEYYLFKKSCLNRSGSSTKTHRHPTIGDILNNKVSAEDLSLCFTVPAQSYFIDKKDLADKIIKNSPSVQELYGGKLGVSESKVLEDVDVVELVFDCVYRYFNASFTTHKKDIDSSVSECGYCFAFKERNTSSEQPTSVYFKLDGKRIKVRAKRDGKTFDKSYKLYKKNINISGVLGALVYMELCRDLKITPYRFLTGQRYLESILNFINFSSSSYSISTKVNSSTFKREKKSERGLDLSMAGFKISYYDSNDKLKVNNNGQNQGDYNKTPISEYEVIVKLKINKEALDLAINNVKEYLETETDNILELDAFKLSIKVAYGKYKSTSSMSNIDNFIRQSIADGFWEERGRQQVSNQKYITKESDEKIFVPTDDKIRSVRSSN